MAKKGGWCDKHKYAFSGQCPNCADERRAAEREEEKRKFPHVSMEAGYQHVYVHWIMIGSDNTPFLKSKFFAGYNNLLEPRFVEPIDGVLNVPVYTSREAAHKEMTYLLDWYKRTGTPVPSGLTIGH